MRLSRTALAQLGGAVPRTARRLTRLWSIGRLSTWRWRACVLPSCAAGSVVWQRMHHGVWGRGAMLSDGHGVRMRRDLWSLPNSTHQHELTHRFPRTHRKSLHDKYISSRLLKVGNYSAYGNYLRPAIIASHRIINVSARPTDEVAEQARTKENAKCGAPARHVPAR